MGALACNLWAPIEQAPPKGHTMLHEASQAELAQKQELQRTQHEVGFVPQTTADNNGIVTAEVTDHQAGTNLVSAQNQADQADAERAKKVLVGAEKVLEKQQPSSSSWLWPVLFGVFGFGTVMGFRSWAAKNIPTGPPSMNPAKEEASQTKRQAW